MVKKYYIITHGCQMNVHDSETIAGILESLGFVPSSEEKTADLIIINTCSVRETAENKVFTKIGELRKLKRENPDLVIGVGGCIPQQEKVAKQLMARFPHLDFVFGTHNLPELPKILEKVFEKHERVLEVWQSEGQIVEGVPVKREPGVRAWVTIMYGCNNFCTYCIVPYVRGRERSRKKEDIIEEIRQLVLEGYREVTLLGQNVNSYGKDLTGKPMFAELLADIDKIEGLWRVRFTTSHPRDLTDDVIDVMASSEKICEHIHLPVQAGSNRILKAMHRGYTREYYLDLVQKIRAKIANVSFTTDIIVGFPGETEDDFRQTLDLVRQVRYDSAFTFVYNKRSGTPAAEMANQVPEDVKSRRIQELIELQNAISLELNKKEEGKIFEVLVEGKSKTNESKLAGRTRTNKLVVFSGSEEFIGRLIKVKITEGKLFHLEGEIA
ncbi:tRNA (N6-isopentenyl adenosine(37)-C2)-methylthiotransferase MiaB [Carboxydothermus pertinax]|uniref:tRNA-2-methylthio-N(6)-dimethylallyladenosine synthase n=1 Tax=Carboxydothermus pertinax TaxID=870242 RepID=A0A1L8CXN3_9THEO|nr:tRNA (N6-isopentenyl adenosine(37)-C2)-methylthiotransferase MiaB [Carboxydothermus pertinax]GAV23641.1 tRNA (N6-isopentenyl adenosine(37)-C2)-methylthiotransferase MiaB [Carboxydothermus pertinax]